MKKAATLVFLSALASGPAASAALYSNDFEGADAERKFPNETTDPRWNVAGGVYTNSYTGADSASSAGVGIGGAAGTAFTLTTRFSVLSATAPTNNSFHTVGLGFLGQDANFVSGGYFADFGYVANGTASEGALRIIRNGTPVGTNGFYDGNAASSALALDMGAIYSLRLTASYNVSNHLVLTFGIYDETGTTQLGTPATFTDTAPNSGSFFGYRNRTGGGSGSAHEIAFDDFHLIPEPSAMLLAAASSAALLRRRR